MVLLSLLYRPTTLLMFPVEDDASLEPSGTVSFSAGSFLSMGLLLVPAQNKARPPSLHSSFFSSGPLLAPL